MAKSKKKRSEKAVVPKRPPVTQAAATPDIDDASSFAEEYGYVRKDLRHLTVISIVLFVVMLGVGFFI